MLNKAILNGRLTKAPELKQTQNGKSVCSFTIAVDRNRDREKTDFVPIVAWGKTAEFVNQWFGRVTSLPLSAASKFATTRTRTAISAQPQRLSQRRFCLAAANLPARQRKSPQRASRADLKKSRATLTTSHSDGR